MAQSTWSIHGAEDINSSVSLALGGVITSGDFSISFWFRPAASTSGVRFLYIQGTGGVIQVRYETSGKVSFSVDGNNVVSGATVITTGAGAWHHICLTCTAAGAQILYVDGASDATGTQTPNYQHSGGHIASDGGTIVNGNLDDFVFTSSILSGSQVSQIYAGTLDVSSLSSKLALIRFEEGSGTTAADSTGNGNTGTLNGTVTWEADVAVPLQGGGGTVFLPVQPTIINQAVKTAAYF